MKKTLLKLLVGTSAVMMLAACGNQSKEDTQNTDKTSEGEVTAWAWDPKFNIAALELAEETYQKENKDFKLNVIENAQDDIVQKLNTGLSSGNMKGLPNLVLIEDYRAKSFLDAFPDAFFPLTDFITASDFIPYKIEATSTDNVNYAIPFDTGVTGLFLRKPIIEKAGLTVDDFENITWEEFITLGKQVKEKTGLPMFSTDLNDTGLVRAIMQSSGSWYTLEDGATPNFENNESLINAFELMKKMLDEGVMITHNGWDQMLSNFNDGKVATTLNGNWITPSVKAEADQAGEWVVKPFPRQADVKGATNASNLGGSSFYVLNVDGKEEAAKFISETFGKDQEFYQRLIKEVGALGSYEPASSGEAYKAKDDFFGGQTVYTDFSNWATEIPAVNFGKNTYAFGDIGNNALQDFLSGKDINAVMKDAQKTAETQVK